MNKVLDQQKHQRELVLYESVVAASSVAIIVGVHSGRVVYANAAYCKLINPDALAPGHQSINQRDQMRLNGNYRQTDSGGA